MNTPNHTAHSAAPWSIEKRLTTEITIRAACKTVIAGVRCDSYLPGYESDANARLMVAAPKLLEALKLFVQQYEGNGHDEREQRPEIIAARAAIAEASGQPQQWKCPVCGHVMTEQQSKEYRGCPTGMHFAQHVPA